MKTYNKIKRNQSVESGAEVVALSCPNCKAQFMEIINYYNLNVEFKDIPEIVPNALVY